MLLLRDALVSNNSFARPFKYEKAGILPARYIPIS